MKIQHAFVAEHLAERIAAGGELGRVLLSNKDLETYALASKAKRKDIAKMLGEDEAVKLAIGVMHGAAVSLVADLGPKMVADLFNTLTVPAMAAEFEARKAPAPAAH